MSTFEHILAEAEAEAIAAHDVAKSVAARARVAHERASLVTARARSAVSAAVNAAIQARANAYSKAVSAAISRIAELERENQLLRIRNEELENRKLDCSMSPSSSDLFMELLGPDGLFKEEV